MSLAHLLRIPEVLALTRSMDGVVCSRVSGRAHPCAQERWDGMPPPPRVSPTRGTTYRHPERRPELGEEEATGTLSLGERVVG